MSGFYAGLWDAWEFAVENMATNTPWPRAAAINDLRWWVDRMGDVSWWRTRRRGSEPGLPPLRELAQRWRWGKDKVRALVEDVPVWADTETGKLGVSIVAVERLRLRAPQTAPAAVSPRQGRESDNAHAANANNVEQIRQDEDTDQTGRGHGSATRDQLRAHDHPSPFTLHPEPDQDLHEEIPGPLEVKQPEAPTPEPPRPAFALAPPNSEPVSKKKPRKAPATMPALGDLDDDQREALAAFQAVLAAFVGEPRCEWIPKPAEDARWLLELHDTIPGVDFPEQFGKMRDWLDGQLRRKQAGKSTKFPTSFQGFMRNWLKRSTLDPGTRPPDRERDPAYRGVPEGYEPPNIGRNIDVVSYSNSQFDPNQPF